MAELKDELLSSDEENVIPSEDNAVSQNDAEEAVSAEIPGFGDEGNDEEEYEKYEKQRKKKRRKKIIISCIAGAVILLAAGGFIVNRVIKANKANQIAYTDVAVSRQTIENTITGSSYIEPNDSYSVMTMTSGEIKADYFNEGDTVKKDDKLYKFDDEKAQDNITTAKNNLSNAQQQYADAVRAKSDTISSNSNSMKSAQNSVQRALISLNSAKDAANDMYITSDFDGKVREVNVKEGDEINTGSAVATIFDDTTMKIRLPFNEFDAGSLYAGAPAEVSVVGSSETVYGTVTDVSSAAITAEANTMVVYATIEVTNPGAIDSSDTGSAVVNGAACADTANFEYINEKTITSKVSGTVKSVDIDKGSSVYAGEQIVYVQSDNAEDNLESAQLSYDDAILQLQAQVLKDNTYSQDSNIKSAQISLENAQLQLKQAQDTADDYTIKSPIEGTVVTKNAKAGDTIDSSNNTTALCEIYDLSCVKLSVEVDETEVALVKVGQEAEITSSATDETYTGKVTKVPVNGTSSNGVTTYIVEIQIDDYGDLLPGMNVDASIVVEEAEDALAVPVNAVNTGNIVFVKDNGKTYKNDVTDMLNGKEDETESDDRKSDDKKSEDKKSEEKSDKASDKESDNKRSSQSAPLSSAAPDEAKTGDLQAGTKNEAGKIDMSSLPKNLEVPDGYRAVVVEVGINDNDYIEIISGLEEGDEVRTIDTNSSSAGASFGSGEESDAMMGGQMNGPGGMGGGQMGGGSGGMGGGQRGGNSGGGGGMGGGPR